MNMTTEQKMIANYILSQIEFTDEREELNVLPNNEKVKEIFKQFYSEYYQEKQNTSMENQFAEWLQGLPTNVNIDFETHKQHELLKKWNIATDKDIEEVDDLYIVFYSKVTETYFKLYSKAVAMNSINFDKAIKLEDTEHGQIHKGGN